MRAEEVDGDASVKLKVSVGQQHGMQLVDLFVDHTPGVGDIRIASTGNGPISMSDHLKLLLTPFVCVSCQSQNVTSSTGWSLREWFLKFTGRKVFVCNDCGSTQVVKVRRCEWEAIFTTIGIAVLLLAVSIYWSLR